MRAAKAVRRETGDRKRVVKRTFRTDSEWSSRLDGVAMAVGICPSEVLRRWMQQGIEAFEQATDRRASQHSAPPAEGKNT